ncbi:MAG: cupin domain-containing protein, partial [Candidatus Rokuibacteriota bacterium]
SQGCPGRLETVPHFGHAACSIPEPPVNDLRAVSTVQIDNARVRVTEWRFEPGATTGHHRHEYHYVVVPLTSGPLAMAAASGETTAELVAGRSYFREAGVEHDVRNANPFVFVFVEIEIKTAVGPQRVQEGPSC